MGHPETGSRVRASLADPLDWNKLRQLAAYHRVQPLLYERLMEYAAGTVPADVLVDLSVEFRRSTARSLYLTGELIAITKAFAAANIAALPHKGPLLAQAAYGDLALREFTDLDLLIYPADLPVAIKLLAECGFLPPIDLGWVSPPALLRWTGEMSYASPRGVSVDLHWRLTPSHYPVQLDPEILWRSRTSVTLAGSELPSVTPEALLLLLAVHGAKHCWEAIGWLADVAWLGGAHPEAWQGAMDLAMETSCQRPLALARSLTESAFQGKPPNDPLCRRVLDRWYDGPLASPASPELFSFAAALARRPSDSLKHLLGVTSYPTEIDWRERRLPESWFWLYAPARVARLCRKYFRRKLPSGPAANAIK